MTTAAHPRHRIVDELTAPVRLSIIAALVRVESVDFKALRESLEVSDSVLSKQVAALETAGFVKVTKGYVGKRPRTWLAATAEGKTALAGHLAALRAIVDGVEG